MGRPTVPLSGFMGRTPSLGNGLPNSQGSRQIDDDGEVAGSPFPSGRPSPSHRRRRRREEIAAAAMGVMGRFRIFVVQEPVVAASCLIAGFGTLSSQSRLPRESFSLYSLLYEVCRLRLYFCTIQFYSFLDASR